MTMTNPDKPITKQDLNDYHDAILPYLGGMPEIYANKFAKGDLYDTNEKIIGKWTDGKPLYRRVYNSTLQRAGESLVQDVSSFNIDKVTKIKSVFNGSSWIEEDIAPTQNDKCRTYIQNNNLYINATSSFIPANVTTCLEYTKTTDQANSFNFGNTTDYSTDEKIIGTWIDGSYIYQKTINVGYIGAQGSREIDVSDLSINLFLSYSGYIIRATNEVIPLPVYFEIIENGKLNSISWIRYYSDKLQFNVTGITNYAITDFYLTIQYTKRT